MNKSLNDLDIDSKIMTKHYTLDIKQDKTSMYHN